MSSFPAAAPAPADPGGAAAVPGPGPGPAAGADGRPPRLFMRQISKRFGGQLALRAVDLEVRAGEVLALMGENGAGKSTLMKILAGAYSADSGQIEMDGRPVAIRSPKDAVAAGVSLIYQELNLAPNLTVAENIFLGEEPLRWGTWVDRAKRQSVTRALLGRMGAAFSPDDVVETLSLAEQQQVEICRALRRDSRVLVMDEPTAALSEREAQRLFSLVRRLREEGLAIIYISHRMEEVIDLADRVTVLRDGQAVGTLGRGEVTVDRVVEMMVGRSFQDVFRHERARTPGAVVLEARNLADGRRVHGVSLSVRAGEILGLGGLVGAGRTETARLLFGADPLAAGGEILLEGRRVVPRSPWEAVRLGICYVPEDRKSLGLFLEMSSRKNIGLNVLPRQARLGVLDFPALRRLAAGFQRDLNIRLQDMSAWAAGLSGGNQQKLLLARWLATDPKVLILDEPTRGIDVGAKFEIYRVINALADKGIAVVLISSELSEVVGLCDRLVVLRQGRVVGELGGNTGRVITQESLMTMALGDTPAAAAA